MDLDSWIQKAEQLGLFGGSTTIDTLSDAIKNPTEKTEKSMTIKDLDTWLEKAGYAFDEKDYGMMLGKMGAAEGQSLNTGPVKGSKGAPHPFNFAPATPSQDGMSRDNAGAEGGNLNTGPVSGSRGAPHSAQMVSSGASVDGLSHDGAGANGGSLERSMPMPDWYGPPVYASSGHDRDDHLRVLARHGPDVVVKGARRVERQQHEPARPTYTAQFAVVSTSEDQRIVKSLADDGSLTVRRGPTDPVGPRAALVHEQELCKSCENPKPVMLTRCPECGDGPPTLHSHSSPQNVRGVQNAIASYHRSRENVRFT